jgi:rubredoxin
VEYVTPDKPPYDSQLLDSYRQIALNRSNSADALAAIHRAKFELLSQSKSAIVSTGQQKEGYKTWFNMVAFDENELTAKRKYFFEIDEKAKVLFRAREGLRFDGEAVLPVKVLNEPYASENARRIAILKQILESFRSDIADVRTDYKALATSGMLVNQAMETILVKLDSSPALAAKLNRIGGVEFDHINLDKGKVQMVVVGDIARVKVRAGSTIKGRIVGDEIYRCFNLRCEYRYDPFVGDPEHNIKPDTWQGGFPEDWVCPVCGAKRNLETEYRRIPTSSF